MNPDYKKLHEIIREENGKLIFNFSQIESLSAFEITELLFYCVNFSNTKDYIIEQDSEIYSYLKKIKFFNTFSKIKNNTYTREQEGLLEISLYKQRTDFYGNQSEIYQMLENFGLSGEKASLVVASLGEIIDNAFSHNLGQWNLDTGSLVISLIQQHKKSLIFSLCDFGRGFMKSLLPNYPSLTREAEAIELAIRPNITGRPQKKGGNGLDFLQRNTFNGFKGNLFIRSGDTLVKIKEYQIIETLNLNLESKYGANICFSLVLDD